MITRESTLATKLSRLIVEALVKIGLTQEEILSGPITHDNLPWQTPPLVVEAALFGVPLSEYLNTVAYIKADIIADMFTDVLFDLRNDPHKVVTPDGYRAMSAALPSIRKNERPLHFTLPDGFPAAIGEYVGVTLGLECAHLLRANAKLTRFECSDDDYYAVLPDGREVGVKAGLPTVCSDIWDIPVTGMVQEMLRTARGGIWEGCDYNIISKIRSVAFEFQKSIRDYEAVDWSLQALRVIEGDRELLAAVRSMKSIAYSRKTRITAMREAVAVVDMFAMTDRQKIETLKGLLVPDIMNTSQFSKQVYNFYVVPPPILHHKVLDRIRHTINELAEAEEALYAQENRRLTNREGVN